MENLFDFTNIEKEIIDLFLNQEKSIRELSQIYKGYGRTKINNILVRYANLSSSNAKRVETRKKLSKFHRKDMENEKSSDKQTKKKIGITNSLLKDKYNSLNDEEKEEYIFEKLNARRRKFGKNEYSIEMLQRKLNSLKEFFKLRNNKIEKNEDQISKKDLYQMLYDYPTLLSISLNNKIKLIVNKLDNKLLNYSQTSKIIRENPGILSSSILRTELQIKILKDSNTLDFAINKPRSFRTSPELMYALIKKWNLEGDKTYGPFISSLRLYQESGKTSDDLKKKFDVKKVYGNDKYFSGR